MGQEEDSVLLQTCTWNLEVKISVQIKFVKQNSIRQFDISVKYDYWPRVFFIFSGGIMYSPLCCSKKIVFTVFLWKDIDVFIQQGRMNLIKSDSEDI